ncbi:cysteine--tRNA ligase [Leptolyngbya sp. 'hensonii']|uniref:cysteine--tRNA ligase n=1 Tax=Leptolyngbya sp. 'hensonii' TaxID=1922337 RepID=UPI00094F55F4|nr:cysteine--tRNA ligase [Leptolyngbya sp. 'hensonii']OLP16413.1 cysteine--tRNA ligase [Leptolyngbya sp. 'hensonii']
MVLTLYNTLTRGKAAFEPLEAGQVRMYCCGVTVYDYCHLGHARSYIVWDVVRRYLQWCGYDVRYIQNFTDIDDKIINRAKEEQKPWDQVTATYIDEYFVDMDQLNIQRADAYPKATEFIPQMIDLIKTLIEGGYAYAAGGDVYYAVERFPSYGKLSGRHLEQMEAGASGRLSEEPETKKHHPMDFALWKAAKPGEPFWESPWGQGRPGWHIECSAMVRELLGDRIDIHSGGEDLVFPHHENEIAQSEAALAQPLATYWLHNGFVKIRGDKMSKSLKNFTTIRALLEVYDPMVVRLFVLQANYRQPIDFTEEAMAAATNGWQTLREGLLFGYNFGQDLQWPDRGDATFGDPAHMRVPSGSPAVTQFQAAMDDDFNTAGALAVLFDLAKDLRKEGNLLVHEGKTKTDPQVLEREWFTLVCLAQVLGLTAKPEAQVLQPDSAAARAGAGTPELIAGWTDAAIEALIQQRTEARKAKNWKEGDRIRDELKAQGITLIDGADGTRWHR